MCVLFSFYRNSGFAKFDNQFRFPLDDVFIAIGIVSLNCLTYKIQIISLQIEIEIDNLLYSL